MGARRGEGVRVGRRGSSAITSGCAVLYGTAAALLPPEKFATPDCGRQKQEGGLTRDTFKGWQRQELEVAFPGFPPASILPSCGARLKGRGENRRQSIPAVLLLIHKQLPVPSEGTMSPLPRLASCPLSTPLTRWLSSPRNTGKAFSSTADENGFTIQFYPCTTSVVLMEPLWMGAGWSQRTAVAAS